MGKKNHGPGPVPAGNRPHSGTDYEPPEKDEPGEAGGAVDEARLQEEDPERRMGDFTGKADHARQQPGPRNDGGKRHGEDAG